MITKQELKNAGITQKRLASYLCRQAALAEYDDVSESSLYDLMWNGFHGYEDSPIDD